MKKESVKEIEEALEKLAESKEEDSKSEPEPIEEDEESESVEEEAGEIVFSNQSTNDWGVSEVQNTSLEQRTAVTSANDFDMRDQNLEDDLKRFNLAKEENVLESEQGFYAAKSDAYTGGQSFESYENVHSPEELGENANRLTPVQGEVMTFGSNAPEERYMSSDSMKTPEELQKEATSNKIEKYDSGRVM